MSELGLSEPERCIHQFEGKMNDQAESRTRFMRRHSARHAMGNWLTEGNAAPDMSRQTRNMKKL
jgi:hypothetical protein